jgi:Ankyrin repeats (3 copies)
MSLHAIFDRYCPQPSDSHTWSDIWPTVRVQIADLLSDTNHAKLVCAERDDADMTPLMRTVSSKAMLDPIMTPYLVQMCIEQGQSDVNAYDAKTGSTVLMRACHHVWSTRIPCHAVAAAAAAAAGSESDSKTHSNSASNSYGGSQSVCQAASSNQKPMATYQMLLDVVRSLLLAGADPFAQNVAGCNVLYCVIKQVAPYMCPCFGTCDTSSLTVPASHAAGPIPASGPFTTTTTTTNSNSNSNSDCESAPIQKSATGPIKPRLKNEQPFTCAAFALMIDCLAMTLLEFGGLELLHAKSRLYSSHGRRNTWVSTLGIAVAYEEVTLIAWLLNRGFDPIQAAPDKVLQFAVTTDQPSVCELLFQHGITLDVHSPVLLNAAVVQGLYGASCWLLNHGVDVNQCDDRTGEAPLHNASTEEHYDFMIDLLLDSGANPSIVNTVNGNTPLHVSISRAFEQITYILIAAGANLNAVNHTGESVFETALMFYLRTGWQPLLKALLLLGAQIKYPPLLNMYTLSRMDQYRSRLCRLLLSFVDPDGKNQHERQRLLSFLMDTHHAIPMSDSQFQKCTNLCGSTICIARTSCLDFDSIDEGVLRRWQDDVRHILGLPYHYDARHCDHPDESSVPFIRSFVGHSLFDVHLLSSVMEYAV